MNTVELEFIIDSGLKRIANALEIANKLKVIEIKARAISVGTYNELMEIEEQLYPEPQPRFSPDDDDGY